MNTGYLATYNDRKEKERKRSLQWCFSNVANETAVPHISDRRDMGVCTKAETKTTGAGRYQGNDSDLCQLLVGQLSGSFLTAMLGPLLPSFLQSVDMVEMAGMVDEIWMDRRKSEGSKSALKKEEISYFPSLTYY